MIDLRYRNGKIYTIRSHLTDRVYVGSTRTTLSRRIGKHKSDYKAYKNGKKEKVTVYDLFDLDPNCYIELHEYYPCTSREQLNKREGELIRELDCVNKCIAGRTAREYRIDNREKRLAYQTQYRIDNRDQILARKKQYDIDNRDQILAYKKQYNKQKYNCQCGSTVGINLKARHIRTKKHKTWQINQHQIFNHL